MCNANNFLSINPFGLIAHGLHKSEQVFFNHTLYIVGLRNKQALILARQ